MKKKRKVQLKKKITGTQNSHFFPRDYFHPSTLRGRYCFSFFRRIRYLPPCFPRWLGRPYFPLEHFLLLEVGGRSHH